MSASAPTSRQIYFRLLAYVRPYWRGFALALAATGITAATEPLLPALLKPLLDNGFSGAKPHYLYTAPLAIIGIFALRGVLGYLSSYGMSWVANKLITDLRQAMFERLVRLPTRYFDHAASSVPMTRISYDVTGVAGAATSVLTVLVRDSLMVIGLLSWLLYLNWQLTLISIVMIPLVGLVIRAFSGRLRAMSRATQTGTAAMTQVLQESIKCQKVVKVFGGETHATTRFAKANNDLRGYGMRQAIAAAATVPIVQLLASIALATVVYVALLQSSTSGTTVGSFVSFITAMLMLLAPMKHLSDVNAPLQRGLAAAESVFALLDEPDETDTGTTELGRAEGRLEFSGLTFRYAGAERDALTDFTLTIAPGETVALVGASGSGKSTLANLVPRFYDPTAGAIRLDGHDLRELTLANLVPRFYDPSAGGIRLDGHDLRELTLASLRRNVALVSQDVALFDDTVAANIAYGGKRGASRGEIEAAARHAHALEFIERLPEGFDTMIGENGARLSGGQRQRLAIARAVLKDAPILILDEATSALDSESERQVQAALDELMRGRTTLVIAHRLSTIERADRIVVLSHGRLAEIGTHAELLAQGGLYAGLYRLQFAESA